MAIRWFFNERRNPALAVSALALAGVAGGIVFGIHYFVNRSHPSAPSSLAKLSSVGRASISTAKKPSGPAPLVQANRKTSRPPVAPDPLKPLLSLYGKRQYTDVEAASVAYIQAGAKPGASVPARKAAVRARHLIAFAAARRHDMKTAQARFAQAKAEASKLPQGGRSDTTPLPGAPPSPTLEEDSAYQHAVCTAALGDRAGAEREYLQFMRDYPESPLVQASIKRIARLHGGDIPKEAEAVWRSAMDTARAKDREHRRDESVCAPECLAELIRRRQGGNAPTVSALADEMKTSEMGTTMAALCDSAKRHGFPKAQGLAVTWAGMKKQSLPLVALVRPRHFVLVEQVSDKDGVTVWDPDAEGVGKPQWRTIPKEQWLQYGSGAVLSLSPKTPQLVQTAQR